MNVDPYYQQQKCSATCTGIHADSERLPFGHVQFRVYCNPQIDTRIRTLVLRFGV